MPRIAVVSTAHIHTKGFLKTIAERTDLGRPHVIWDDNPRRGRKYADENGCPFEADLDKVVSDEAVEGFVVCAENTRHVGLLAKVLPAGKPTMCEKPLATTVADAAAIGGLVRRHGAALTSGYVQPFSAGNRGVRKLLGEGALGKVTQANVRNAHHAAYGRWFDSPELAWFAEPELSGGGALLDMGTHALHLLLHLFGPVAEVWAMTANLSGNYPKVDDYGLVEMRFASGVIGRVEAGWVFTGGHGGLEIIGSEKSVWSQGDGLVIGGPGSEAEPVAPADARPTRIERLVAMIRGEIAVEELAEDLRACLWAVTTMATAYESAATGRWSKVAHTPD